MQIINLNPNPETPLHQTLLRELINYIKMEPGTYEKTVAVAVKKGKYSQLALKWAVENLAKETSTMIMFVHVRPKAQAFNKDVRHVSYHYNHLASRCGEEIAKELEHSYKETLNLQAKEMFSPFTSYCKRRKVQSEEVIVEDSDPAKGIADFVLQFNIDVLVIGAGSGGGILRRLMGPEMACKIAKHAPYFCTVYTIGKAGAVSVKNPSTSAQAPPTLTSSKLQKSETCNNLESVNSQREPLISVSARESLLEPKPDVEFKFRSPLQNYGDSDFAWKEPSQTDTDISYISSDKDYYERLSSSYSTNSSNFSIGSFDSWQAPSAMTPGSDASYSSEYNMDEMRKLQLEMIQTKKMYEAACQDSLGAKMQAPKWESNEVKEGNGMKRVQLHSGLALAKHGNDDETAARINHLRTRLAEMEAERTSRYSDPMTLRL